MSLGKPTEMTLRDLLIEELKRRNVLVVTEVSFRTLDGRRLVPDMILRNGAQYIVETKLGAEAKLLDATVQLYDYCKHVGDAKGAFAVLFPEDLRRPLPSDLIQSIARDPKTQISCIGIFKDLRPSQSFKGNLLEVVSWISMHVLRPLVVEADTGFAIKVLRDAVEYIMASAKQLQSKDLEDIFGGKSVFENVLQFEEGRYPLEEMRQAATYLLVNQLLFYHILTRAGKIYPVIDEDNIKHPADLQRYFEPVLYEDYASVFGFNVASRLPDSASEAVRKTVMAVKALAPEKARHDLLGKIFHELIPFAIRKSVAAFYTNNEAAEILAQLAIDEPDAKVIDLAVGSGTLLVAAYRRKMELLREKRTFTLDDHKRFLEKDLTGVDIMPFAAHMAVVHLSLQALAAGLVTEKARVAVWDSTCLSPGQTIPAISKELKVAYRRPTLDIFMKERPSEKEVYVEKGVLSLEGIGREQIKLDRVDLALMNPPFTRQERLPEHYKEMLTKRFENYADYLHGQIGLYGYFILLADRFVQENGKIALVLPATFLRVRSAEGIRRLLIRKYQITHIITTWERAAFSEGAQFREILLVASSKTSSNNSNCCITSLKRLPQSVEEAREFAATMRNAIQKAQQGRTYTTGTMTLRVVPQQELEKNLENMYLLISSQDLRVPALLEQVVSRGLHKLSRFGAYVEEVKAEILRLDYKPSFHGTFAVQEVRAIKKIDQWVIERVGDTTIALKNRFTEEQMEVPVEALVRGLRRPSRTDKMNLTDGLDYVIVSNFEGAKKLVENPQALRKWKKYIRSRLTNLLISRRFDISATGTELIAYYSSTPMVGIDMWHIKGIPDEDARILALWLNSTLSLLSCLVYRAETRGAWMKLHEYGLRDLYVISPRTISANDRTVLLELFTSIKDISFPSVLDQLRTRFPTRIKIDKAMLKILGYTDDEAVELLDFLYPALTSEIEQLKKLMEG